LELSKLPWDELVSIWLIQWDYPDEILPVDKILKVKVWATLMFIVNEKNWDYVNWTLWTILEVYKNNNSPNYTVLKGSELYDVNYDDKNLTYKYLGKVIRTRSPLYCNTKNTEWCVYCLGDKLTINKNALPLIEKILAKINVEILPKAE
jgi:hypothetical protein